MKLCLTSFPNGLAMDLLPESLVLFLMDSLELEVKRYSAHTLLLLHLMSVCIDLLKMASVVCGGPFISNKGIFDDV